MNQAKKNKNIFQRIRAMDLTSGNLFLKLGIFALPIALASIFQLLYTTVDLMTVHMGNGENSAAAISGNTALINLIVVMFSGMSIGANVAIGNAIGAKDYDHAQKVLSTSVIFSLITGVIVGIFGFIVTPFLLDLIKIEPMYLEEATTYLRIYFVGLPFLMLYNYGSQIHRSMGDSSTPFIVLVISGVINIGFDCLFVFTPGLRLGVAGVAWATVISECVSSILITLSLVTSKTAVIHFNPKKIEIDFQCLGEIVRLGLPAGLQGFFFALPNTIIQSALYDIGAGNVALQNGAIAANNLNNYNYAFIETFSPAPLAIVAQNYGAKNKENIKKMVKYGFIWITIYSAVYSLISAIFYHPLLALFVDYNNVEAIEAGRQRLWLIGFTYVLDGYMDIMAGTMKGVRKPTIPAIITALTCTVFRIIFIEFFVLRIPEMRNVLWLYSAYPISWTMANIASAIVLPLVLKKAFEKIDSEQIKTAQ
ncbi:MAG: MATE family efflux transporter [Bacilli bacterium]|nr:MATE family efflux transporter [Bacilli bacterium]